MSSFKNSENIQKKECGPDRSVSDNQSASMTLNELAEHKFLHYKDLKCQHLSLQERIYKFHEVYV